MLVSCFSFENLSEPQITIIDESAFLLHINVDLMGLWNASVVIAFLGFDEVRILTAPANFWVPNLSRGLQQLGSTRGSCLIETVVDA